MIRIITAATWQAAQRHTADCEATIQQLRDELRNANQVSAGRLAALGEAHEQIAALTAERAEAAQVIMTLSLRLGAVNASLTSREPHQRPFWGVRLADGSIAGPFSRS